MDEKNAEKKRKYIQEKIVPNRRLKKAILTVLSVTGLAVLFGLVAGVVFTYARQLFGEERQNPIQTIVIARDEITEEESESSSTEPEPEDESEEATQGPEEQDPEETVREIIHRTTEMKVMYDASSDRLKEVNHTSENGIVRIISVTRSGGILEPETVDEQEALGMIVGSSGTVYYVLTDSSSIPEGAELTVRLGREKAEAQLVNRDDISNKCVLSFNAEAMEREPAVLKLGQSTKVTAADDVYLVGFLNGTLGASDSGLVSLLIPSVDITDGYVQEICTNIPRRDAGAAVLFNRSSEVIGWVPASEDAGFITAEGISPLKYLIEDMCSDIETAYLGVNCTELIGEDAAKNGVPDGFYVRSVIDGSPAFLSGIQPGDRLTGLGIYNVTSGRSLVFALDEQKAGGDVEAVIERLNGDVYEQMTIPIRLGSR